MFCHVLPFDSMRIRSETFARLRFRFSSRFFEKFGILVKQDAENGVFGPSRFQQHDRFAVHILGSFPATDDGTALDLAFRNLIANAARHARQGGWIGVSTAQWADGVEVRVCNERERIFEPFYRIRENPKQKGTGIGLTLARSLTQLHQGSLYVKDTTNGMNTFVLCLPLQPPIKKK